MVYGKEVVTSRQNPTVKLVCSLADKKTRRAERAFRFDGVKLFSEAIACRLDVTHVVLSDNADKKIKSNI